MICAVTSVKALSKFELIVHEEHEAFLLNEAQRELVYVRVA
jgi:hypothetical protein